MRTWHARRIKEPAGIVGRLFILHDPVDPAEAREALGDLAPLLDAGLLVDGPGGVVSPVHLALAGDAFCFGDLPGLGGDAVMPICGATMDLVRAVTPPAPVDRALDLGCGAGPVALMLARSAARVVATDVSPRAIAYTRLNLTLHGIDNVELREGDLYEPVRGERFDRIAAHPPFVARPDGARASTFVHGGARGDELPLRVLAGAAGHLSSSGRAVVLGDWPVVEEDPLDARVRAAVGGIAADVLVLQSPPKNLDEYCALLAAVEHGELGDAFTRAAIAHRDHLDRLGLRGLALACVVVSAGAGWTSLVSIRHIQDAPVTAEAIERLIAARSLALALASGWPRRACAFPQEPGAWSSRCPTACPPPSSCNSPPGVPNGRSFSTQHLPPG